MTIKLDKLLPASLNLSGMDLSLLWFFLGFLLVFILARYILGRDSGLKHALVSALGILVMYAIYVIIRTFDPAGLSRFLTPLPYVSFTETKMVLFDFRSGELIPVCRQILSMLILAFLVNQINSWTPNNSKTLGWLLYRLCGACVAILVHYLTYYLLEKFTGVAASAWLQQFAPVVLLGIVLIMFSLGFLKMVIGLFLTVVNPVLGGIFAFFFMNKIGRNISRAIGTTVTLTLFVMVLTHLGYHSFPITAAALTQYIPFGIFLMFLWALIGHKL